EDLKRVIQSTGAALIHPYNDYRVICGQGTAALELCEDIPGLDIVMTPVGGGGLLSGTAIAVKGLSPQTRVMAGEPERADDACRSLKAGRIIPVKDPDTIADGLRTSLGDLTFSIIEGHVKDIITVSEEGIIAAMRLIWERMKIVVEPSASVPLGAIMGRPKDFTGKRIGIILSGGNVDLDTLPWIGQESGHGS
ncbi:MAG: pyridoxal-phosphate dependent enzyme, partial [Deltaproteobacteria bacterium]|nr:pyridoxal-phosphate dependent enzyme [Deltaproteobacteria bacterium]